METKSVSTQTAADPQTLARISKLELRARTVMEGLISGMHRSPHRGSSVEFAQHRDYVPGDEIRHIDWKVYARSDRFHIKQFEEETNLKAILLLDISTSMEYKGQTSALSKREYASVSAAAIASLLLRQRDSVGLALFSQNIQRYIPPSSAPSHLRILLDAMGMESSGTKSGIGETLHDIAERMKRRGIALLFSDLFTDIDQLLRGMRHLKHKRHEVILFHVLDADEITFPFKNATRFEGLEDEEALTIEPNAIRKQYLEAFSEFVKQVEKGCREMGADYVQLRTDLPVDTTLSKYLASRSAQGK